MEPNAAADRVWLACCSAFAAVSGAAATPRRSGGAADAGADGGRDPAPPQTERFRLAGLVDANRFVLIIVALACADWAPACAKPAVVIKAPGKRIANVTNLRSYRWIDARDEATGLRIDGFTLRYGRAGIRIAGNASDIVIRNGSCTTKGVTRGSDLPVCIDLRGGVRDVLVENVVASGHRMEQVEGKYTNGDGFSQESGVRDVTYRRDTARDNSDGGFDLKGRARLIDLTAERNGRNYRFWGDIEAGTITSVDPRGSHVWINAKAEQTIVIDRLVARSSTPAPVIDIGNAWPISLTIRRCELAVPRGMPLVRGGAAARLQLGPGCRVGGETERR